MVIIQTYTSINIATTGDYKATLDSVSNTGIKQT